MARTDITQGTSFRGPLYVTDVDGNELVLTPNATALPAAVDNDTGGTADTTDFTLVAIDESITGVDGAGDSAASVSEINTQLALINDNFATIAALLDRILDRIQ